MPHASQGPRLYAQPARRDPETGAIIEHAVWVIRDGRLKRSTRIRVDDDRCHPGPAEQALGDYIVSKHAAPREGAGAIDAIPVSNVIEIYVVDKAESQA